MFKKLRNNLLLLNMATISIVMVAAFAVIYFITYSNIQKENQNKLESIPALPRVAALVNPELGASPTNNPDAKISGIRMPVGYSPSFAVFVDDEGRFTEFISYIEMPDGVYPQAASEVWSTGKVEGTISLENRDWQYRISPIEKKRLFLESGEEFILRAGGYQIAFLDITDSSKTLTRLLITFGIIGSATLFVLFGVSYHFANRAIRPIEVNWKKQKQ